MSFKGVFFLLKSVIFMMVIIPVRNKFLLTGNFEFH